ncbi:hypothetical protein C8F01DRAFT_1130989 [Mycena amicta]|nr:hypothetical protein C8F01DRAFT_1130989 [Mycena amicta]
MYLPIQELCDHIIDLLQDSPNDLKACSLVCRSFVNRAQGHLFRTIQINPPSRHECTLWVERIDRFCEILRSGSTHLLDHVRRIYIRISDPRIVARMGAIPWSRSVQSLSLLRIPSSGVLLSAGVRAMVEIPSLEDLALSFTPSPDVDTPARADLKAFFSRCSQAGVLKTLSVVGCSVKGHPASSSRQGIEDVYQGPRIRGIVSPLIRKLKLSTSPALLDIFNSPFFPLDFSQLVYLQLSELHPRMNAFFRRNCSSVTTLVVQGGRYNDNLPSLDLSAFSALTSIEYMYGWPNDVIGNLPPGSTGNRVSHLCLHTIEMNFGPTFVYRWQTFEALVLRHLPLLARVEIVWQANPDDVGGSGLLGSGLLSADSEQEKTRIARLVEDVLPRLHERRLLSFFLR